MKRDKRTPYQSGRLALMLFLVLIGFVSIYVLRSATGLVGGSGWLHTSVGIGSDWQSLIVVGWLVVEEILLWFGSRLIHWHPLALILPQLAFGLLTTIQLTGEMPVVMIGVIPVVGIEIIMLYPKPRRPLAVLGVAVLLMWGLYGLYNGAFLALVTLQGLVFVLFVVWFYWRMFKAQLNQRQHAEDLLAELKIAYAQVEESTVRTERQRVARELHDTLTQGLAGTVMQLEAAQAFLESGKNERALDVIKGATNIARETLRDSRLTLTDLRSTSEKSLGARVELLADAFKKNYGLQTNVNLKDVPDYSDVQLAEITRIVSEALINVVKHTNTSQAIIRGETKNDVFTLQVIDFGEGDTVKTKKGHFGMQGMHERAAALEGVLTVISTPGEGTTVSLILPTTKKEQL
ncbi:sensor histidine kinase [Secundilactobacillus yichangensis]|uniref:sensor histidine kinase n=1 Tax=Secundilactobacillus yichangensis TaxID=2799580 RepID=UPI001942124E|nr:sensor histidine kinase [Secundilactobacillus yichangensis]